jgi:hypothetical protein
MGWPWKIKDEGDLFVDGLIVDSMELEGRSDRRSADRFPIVREVHYKILSGRDFAETGGGETINMSSSGILFTAEHEIKQGKRLELSVSWPAWLNDKCRLKLVAKGQVVRAEDGRAAMRIEKHEFRTRGTQNSLVSSNGF